ncbi:MAG: thymidine phosphorylase, partial [Acidimicrobiaceae bacterium]|nr:thymidine phosphorylase [Acidimicrobiaceae bacterium]
MTVFHAIDVIKAKRDGESLTDTQIRSFIQAYTYGQVAEEQAAALLMAVVWQGMTTEELSAWTAAMVASGDRL